MKTEPTSPQVVIVFTFAAVVFWGLLWNWNSIVIGSTGPPIGLVSAFAPIVVVGGVNSRGRIQCGCDDGSNGRNSSWYAATSTSVTTTPATAESNHPSSSSSSSDREQQQLLFAWGPPPPIRDLKIGETTHGMAYNDAFNITKVCDEPPIYILRNFLTPSERTTLMDLPHSSSSSSSTTTSSSNQFFTPAKTSAGVIEHRTKSSVAWISETDHPVVEFMTQLTARMFCHRDSIRSGRVQAERLQIVRYEPDGKFDLHHDGYNRTVTVLTYVNGIAGTWFPYVGAPITDMPTVQLHGNTDTLLQNKQPGRHGLLFVGDEVYLGGNDDDDDDDVEEEHGLEGESKHPHVVRIHPGDAVAFYNYEPSSHHHHDDDDGDDDTRRSLPIQMAWRSLHCGLPAKSIKWIATNWFTTI
jgi:hypothetical protein